MGPTDGVLGGWERAMAALEAAHPTLTHIHRKDGRHVATWMEDDGAKVAEYDTGPELVAYLRARFGKR